MHRISKNNVSVLSEVVKEANRRQKMDVVLVIAVVRTD